MSEESESAKMQIRGTTDRETFLSGGGEMGTRIREFDWANTPLGPTSSWSPSLKMMVRFLLANRFPLLLWWGPQFIQIYNDPYRPVLGTKHPELGLGRPVSECWSEIWHILRPLVETPFNGGPATWMEDIPLEINRYGFVEETHFTIAYSPVPDETVASGIGGVLATVHEISEKVVGERRVTVLRDLASWAVEARSAEEACAAAAETLARHPKDVPFALLYLLDADGKSARLAGASGVTPGDPAGPPVVDLGDEATDGGVWPLAEVASAQRASIVDDLASRLADAVPAGPWADPPRQAVVMHIRSNVAHRLAGLLVVGVSPRLRLDDSYKSFVELAASQIATAIATARAYEEEKRRAEALAEIDRAKTVFFSNVSHEFRTPLTLMLGPIEDALAESKLPAQTREQLEVAHRNSLRLLKLVNSLLDFSRIEAGRIDAVYEPVDLAAFTAELASVFRSTIEKAGLRLVVDLQPLGEDVYVDRQMWEKIVFNLLSNAFKFTFDGEIEVSLRARGDEAELVVRDTGTGIAADDLAHVFERFHRVENARGRTVEGSGIGLALVRELARLHGGSVRVESEPGRGSTFRVTVPLGKDHLPAERIGVARALSSTGVRGEMYVEEALRWLPNLPQAEASASSLPTEDPREARADGSSPASLARPAAPYVLLADDNADMRDYVKRLLSGTYDVVAVENGEAALEAIRERTPDLVLTDVMMPKLDGFGLLAALRADESTKAIPVIMLSARVGEEARVEGFAAGADDYLDKPFSARELLARVEARLEIARVRREGEQRVLDVLSSLTDAFRKSAESLEREQAARAEAEDANRLKDEFLATISHELRTPLNSMLGWTRLLRGGRLDEAMQARAVETIERNTLSQAKLIEDLLDVSRIITGKLLLTVQPVDLGTVIRAAVDSNRPAADAKGVRLEMVLDAYTDTLLGDSERLQQVVWNLVSNAVKFTDRGGMVQVHLERIDSHLELSVSDTGRGIEPEFLPHVFDRFRQADGGTSRQYGGLGLGLAIVRHIVELHGGHVGVESRGLGRGTKFVACLPLTGSPCDSQMPERDQTVPAPEPLLLDAMLSLRGIRVLVVDDEVDARELLEHVLGSFGAEVRTAGSAAEALAILDDSAEWQPDALISDIGMPGMDGYTFIRAVRSHASPLVRHVPAIALTAYARAEDRGRVLAEGFERHLAKPVEPAELVVVVKSLTRHPM